MRSRISCFNGTLLRKNLTRLAPLWGLYTLCLLMGMVIMYGDTGKLYWLTRNLGDSVEQIMPVVNLFYAPVVTMLLFGDLYNSRMCNALHAMPVRRETMFCTNVLSGLLFSLIPTAIMALVSVPLLLRSNVVDAWMVAPIFLLGSNLQFFVFFGFSLVCAQLVGSRYVMGLMYLVLNVWPAVLYTFIAELYVPMLYGVVTPEKWVRRLSPFYLVDNSYILFETPYQVRQRLGLAEGADVDALPAMFEIEPEGWQAVLVWCAVALVLIGAALLLYRRRHLEKAGDAAAFPVMEPVLLVLAAITGGFLGFFGLGLFFGYRMEDLRWVFLAVGLAVGWFAGKMIIARSTRVFRPKNWLGLLAVLAVFAGTVAMTAFDIFRIDDYIPEKQDIAEVRLSLYNGHRGVVLTEEADIEAMRRLQALALEDRAFGSIHFENQDEALILKESATAASFQELVPCRFAGEVSMTYTLKNGREIRRSYYVWSDEEEADIVRSYLSRWEVVSRLYESYDYTEFETELEKHPVRYVYMDGLEDGESVPEFMYDTDTVRSFLEAVRLDCAEGTMLQSRSYHNCYFLTPEGEYASSFSVNIGLETTEFGISVYADSRHTLQWLQERGLIDWMPLQGAMATR